MRVDRTDVRELRNDPESDESDPKFETFWSELSRWRAQTEVPGPARASCHRSCEQIPRPHLFARGCA